MTRTRRSRPELIEKCPTGIAGVDEITNGGVPRGRATLVCGSAGSGKTMLGTEFLARGVLRFREPGVLVTFEEAVGEYCRNATSIGFDLKRLIRQGMLVIDHIRADRRDYQETGAYDLEGLFVRIGHAIDTIGARRVVIDSLESLFGAIADEGIVRLELKRLLQWLGNKGVTAIVTAERGESTLTRRGLDEYVADCVLLLDHRVNDQISTRRMRVVKYRGSAHGANEYPFMITSEGISLQPVTAMELNHRVPVRRITTGIPKLDEMMGGKGFFRGSSILVSGAAGTGKSSLAAAFVCSVCKRGERCLYFAFEESMHQILRNMKSISIDLSPFVDQKVLLFEARRPSLYGLEMHLLTMERLVDQYRPQAVVIDPITNLVTAGAIEEVHRMLARMIDFLKGRQITALFTSLTAGERSPEQSEVNVSSLMDTWLILRNIEDGHERRRGLYVLKSRGMLHSNQIRELRLSSDGIDVLPVRGRES